jgi:glucose-6-phosphate 1-dehydrogenase
MIGDQTLFIRGDEAEAAWAVIDPLEEGWAAANDRPAQYAPGSWGPKAAMDLIEMDGRRWFHSLEAEDQPLVACAL